MNSNLETLAEKLLSSEELASKFSMLNTMDELYKFCTSIIGGYSEDEFEEFIITMLEYAEKTPASGLSENQLDEVSGGKSPFKPGVKIAAMTLAALTGVGAASVGLSGSNIAKAADTKPSLNASQNEQKKSTWQKVKDWVIKHKKVVAAGTLGAVALAGLSGWAVWKYNHNKPLAAPVEPTQETPKTTKIEFPKEFKDASEDSLTHLSQARIDLSNSEGLQMFNVLQDYYKQLNLQDDTLFKNKGIKMEVKGPIIFKDVTNIYQVLEHAISDVNAITEHNKTQDVKQKFPIYRIDGTVYDLNQGGTTRLDFYQKIIQLQQQALQQTVTQL